MRKTLSVNLSDAVGNVRSREDLAAFVSALRQDLESDEPDWENPTLERYLEALAAWITDSPGYFKNRGEPVPSEPTWEHVARMLYAAGFYE
jgi:hypothetical protein